jgi:branched-subunit amino acid ABC-type transport system permease component
MKIALLAILGLFLGGIVGGVAGVALGFLYTTLAHTTSFEGYSGMLVFFTFMPIGIIFGALIGAVGLGFVGGRDNTEKRPTPTR